MSDGVYIEQNRAHLQLLGYSDEDIRGMTPAIHFGETGFNHIAEVLAKSGTFNGEMASRKKSGEEVILSLSAFPVLNSAGEIRCFVGIKRDVTEKRKAEQQLRESEQSYRGIFNSLNEAVYIQDENGVFLDVNEGAARMYGFPREYFIGKTPADLDAPGRNELPAIVEKDGKAYTGEPQSFEFWALNSHGEEFPKEVHLYPGEYFGKKVVIAVATDISERKRSELAIRRNADFLARLVETASEGVSVCQACEEFPFVRFSLWNDRMTEMTGYTMEEINEKGWYQSMYPDPERQAKAIARMERMRDGDNLKNEEWMVTTRSGEQRYFAISTSVMLLEDSSPAVVGLMHDVSERIKAEEVIKASEERLNLAQKIGQVGIWDWRPQTGELIWTEETFNIFGYKPGEVVPSYELFLEHLIGPDREKLRTAIQSALEDHSKYDIDCQFLRRDGEICFGYAQGQVFFDANDLPIRMLGTFQDISERKRSELALLRETEFRSTLLEQASEGVVVWHPGDESRFATFLTWNPRMQEITGYTMAEINEKGWLDTVYTNPAEREKARAMMADVLNGRVNTGTDFEITTKNGEQRSIHISSKQVKTGDTQSLVLAVVQDFTARKQAERELLQAKFVMENAPFNITFLDEHANIHYLNKTARDTFGITEEAVKKGLKLIDIDPEASDEIWSAHWQDLKKNKRVFIEREHRRQNGELFPVEIIANYMQFGDEAFNAAFDRDVSVQKQLEEQLRQSQKMEAIGTLVGGIAHDFNNMLAAIQGNLYLARHQMRHHPVVDDKLANIEQLGNRAAEMVQQLLTFARKGAVQMQSLQLNPFFKEAFKLARTAIPENILQQIEICSEPLCIHGDPTQLQQVVMNLLNNAVDAVTETPHPRIECILAPFEADEPFRNMHPELQQQQFARITVRDNGSGIPEHLLNNIFEPFFSTKEIGKGTGLGLAMVYGAIKTHAGAIDVNSHPGHGTRFDIYLPLITTGEEEPDAQLQGIYEGRGECILLVDDDESVRKTTAEVLESMGYQVIQATDGEDAMEWLPASRNRIRLVITDIVMPRMGGIALLQVIRQQDDQLPVLLSTGYDKTHVLDSHINLSHCQQITKPFSFDQLALIIRELIDGNNDRSPG